MSDGLRRTHRLQDLLTIRRRFRNASRLRIRAELCARTCFRWFQQSDFARLFAEVIGGTAVIVTLVVAGVALKGEIAQREKDRIVRAWTVIAMSPDARGNIGQKEAIEVLHERGIEFPRVNLAWAYLPGVKLDHANLAGAILNFAVLDGANLHDAELGGAELFNVDLTGADLSGAVLSGAVRMCANLSGANLTLTNLSDADLRDIPRLGCKTRLSREQVLAACAHPESQPKLPKRFDRIKLKPCPNRHR